MGDRRTDAQRRADELDLEVFNLMGRLSKFALKVRDLDLDEATEQFRAIRRRLRAHMHPDDVNATAGGE